MINNKPNYISSSKLIIIFMILEVTNRRKTNKSVFKYVLIIKSI